MNISLLVGPETVESYKRLSYSPWHALAELVDNSTQAYFDNREILDQAYEREGVGLEVDVVYERDDDVIRVSDNSIGMSADELAYALRVGARPRNASWRSRFGMGLKTSACWLGNEWSVRTKKLGETTEYTVLVDVARVASGDTTLPTTEKPNQDPSKHYTIITIKKLNQRFHGRTIGKIKQYLSSMYRQDLRTGALTLRWQGVDLDWVDSEERFAQARDGTRYRRDFSFEVDGKEVRGWVGVLDFGHGGRPYAGFSMLHADRVIRGWPDSWRPESIFGDQEGGRNDLVNQRITGEIHLNGFEVTHTKDDIVWLGDQEEQVEKKLAAACKPFVDLARDRRRPDMQGRGGPSDVEIKTAVDEIKHELSSSELADLINLEDVPPPEVLQQSAQPVLDSIGRRMPDYVAKVGGHEVDLYLAGDLSRNDPYLTVDTASVERVVVAVNLRHPYLEEVSGSVGMRDYLRYCVYDAIAEWQALHKTGSMHPSTIRTIKDGLLRLPSQIEAPTASAGSVDGVD
jgi:hypothetical protein